MPTTPALCRPVLFASMNPSVADYALIQIVWIGAAYGDRDRSPTARTGRTVRGYQPELPRRWPPGNPGHGQTRARPICMLINRRPWGYRPLLPLVERPPIRAVLEAVRV
jgi:hypothetical protein